MAEESANHFGARVELPREEAALRGRRRAGLGRRSCRRDRERVASRRRVQKESVHFLFFR